MQLKPLVIALQGIGFGALATALQGFALLDQPGPKPEEGGLKQPGPNGRAALDRNRAKRIAVFPSLPRFRAKKKRDDEFLLLMR